MPFDITSSISFMDLTIVGSKSVYSWSPASILEVCSKISDFGDGFTFVTPTLRADVEFSWDSTVEFFKEASSSDFDSF